MKRRFGRLAALCMAVTLALSIGVSAQAAKLPSISAGYTMTEVKANITKYGTHYFHSGLMPVMEVTNTDTNGYTETKWTYLNTKGELVDLGQGKEVYGFDFSEGLAPFLDRGIGYMDATGQVVIPAQFDSMDTQGVVQTGRFINGNALVFRATGMNDFGMSEGSWVQIDKTGKVVAKTIDENKEGVIYSDVVGNGAGVVTETVTVNGTPIELEFSEGFALLDWGINGDEYYVVSKVGGSSAPTAPTAKYTNSNIVVNGKSVALEVYNINDNNYFKLRDLAQLVCGTGKQFEVTWDGAKNAINLTSGKPYTTVGGELAAGNGADKAATINTSTIYKDDVTLALAAYTINGNNYFKLRDLCRAFDIGVTWDGATNTVGIDPSLSYRD